MFMILQAEYRASMNNNNNNNYKNGINLRQELSVGKYYVTFLFEHNLSIIYGLNQ